MLKRSLAVLLAVLLLNLVCYAQAGTKTKEAEEADRVFASVFRIGAGMYTLVKVKMRDGTELKGYIREFNQEQFVIVARGTGEVTRLKYQQVKQVKPYESRGRKVGSVLGYVGITAMIVGMAIGYARK